MAVMDASNENSLEVQYFAVHNKGIHVIVLSVVYRIRMNKKGHTAL